MNKEKYKTLAASLAVALLLSGINLLQSQPKKAVKEPVPQVVSHPLPKPSKTNHSATEAKPSLNQAKSPSSASESSSALSPRQSSNDAPNMVPGIVVDHTTRPLRSRLDEKIETNTKTIFSDPKTPEEKPEKNPVKVIGEKPEEMPTNDGRKGEEPEKTPDEPNTAPIPEETPDSSPRPSEGEELDESPEKITLEEVREAMKDIAGVELEEVPEGVKIKLVFDEGEEREKTRGEVLDALAKLGLEKPEQDAEAEYVVVL